MAMVLSSSRRHSRDGHHGRRRRGSRRLRIFLFLALIGILATVAPSGWRAANSTYREWKRDRALRQAKEFFSAKEYSKALLAMQVAIRTDWDNPAVWREIADMSETIGAREAVMQRQHVVTLSRGALEDQLSLALTALRFGDTLTAADALRAVPEMHRSSVQYRRVAVLFSLKEGASGIADYLVGNLLRTDKSDELRFTHATIRMSNPNQAVAVAARLELAGLTQNPKFASVALRELLSDAILRSDWEAAKSWGERLVKSPDAIFRDRLALATLQVAQEKTPLETLLPDLQAQAGKTARDAVDLASWLVSQRQTPRAIAWIDALPADLRDKPELRAARLDLALATQDWAGAGEMLYQGAAGPIEAKVIRAAIEARAVAGLVDEGERMARWKQALEAARGDIVAHQMLYRLSVASKWEPEAEATLLAIAQSFPGQTWAHEGLARVYQAHKNAPGMRRILGIWQQQWPDVARLRNDWAVIDMLVDPTPSWNRAKQAAEDLHKNDPQNSFYATTCAFAYAQAGRVTEALATLDKLKPAERRFPPRAPYLALVYAEAGKIAETRAQLELVRPETLYKEELRLVDLARTKVGALEKQKLELRRLSGADALKPKS